MKRFTETDKWRDTWFRKLRPLSKLAFLYVVDNCDAAGVWDPDFELADFTIGEEIAWPMLLAEFGERVEVLKNGKWHLTRFIEFQYGAELVEECRPHAKVLQLLRAHGIPYRKGIKRVSIPTIQDRTGQDNTGKDRVEASNAPAEPPPPTPVEVIYAAYPRKSAKADALKAIAKAIDKSSHAAVLQGTQAYAAAVALWPEDERQYVPHPATWFNRGSYEDDPATWIRNAAPGNNRFGSVTSTDHAKGF